MRFNSYSQVLLQKNKMLLQNNENNFAVCKQIQVEDLKQNVSNKTKLKLIVII